MTLGLIRSFWGRCAQYSVAGSEQYLKWGLLWWTDLKEKFIWIGSKQNSDKTKAKGRTEVKIVVQMRSWRGPSSWRFQMHFKKTNCWDWIPGRDCICLNHFLMSQVVVHTYIYRTILTLYLQCEQILLNNGRGAYQGDKSHIILPQIRHGPLFCDYDDAWNMSKNTEKVYFIINND